MSNNKGFTLVELAIVLVVIGLILGMAVKGKDLIDSAKYKTELTKVDKISSAISVYYSKYSQLPGDINNNGVISGDESDNAVDNITGSGILGSKDFTSDIGGGRYEFVQCSNDPTGFTTGEGSGTCIRLTDGNAPVGTDRHLCILEVGLDDRNLNGGFIRKGSNESAPASLANLDNITGTGSCGDLTDTTDNTEYLIKVW